MLSGDSMFPRIGDATQRAQLEARTLALLAAGIRTALITALIGPALIAWLTAPTIGLAAAIGPAALLYLITIDRVLFARRVARYLAAPGGASARPWLNAFTWRTGLSALWWRCGAIAARMRIRRPGERIAGSVSRSNCASAWSMASDATSTDCRNCGECVHDRRP